MRGTYSFGKRLLAIILCIAMVAAYFPGMALTTAAAQIGGKQTDPATINRWKELFGESSITTEYAGGVWTDKSVFDNFDDYLAEIGVSELQGPTAAITSQVRDMLDTDPENFLVALSAIAANQQITGYTTTPTDTMLVLDVSQSMDTQGYIPGMIAAANNTIKTLMSGNQHNRVGVVLFCGNQYQGENQPASTTIVLLPLDHYTSSNSEGSFLKYTGSTNDTTVYVADDVKDGNGDAVNNRNGKTTIGATYTQNGLYKAWGEFSKLTAADTVIPAGQPQAGTKRIPAVVLMSDGQPTIGDTTYYDIGTSSIGNGGTPNETTGNRLTFLTQLTAAWVKEKIANKYSIKNEEVRFYTLGLNTSTNRYATDTLNPAASNNTTVADYWDDFIAATPNNRGQVTLGGNGNYGGWTTYKSTDGMITSASQRVYPTQYFAANDTAKLAEAFATIASELTVGTPYVTLVSDGEANLDGYITFEDQLGAMMEVKDIKGLVMGDRVFTGAELAKSMNEGDLGQSSNPKDYGNEFVRTVKERLGITDTTVAQNLIRNAYHSGQLSYTSATEYSNYIGWYADAEGNYVGFWQESDGYGADAAPEGAAYINKSYGYLGAESTAEGASDMMHVVVMVHTEIATGDQSIIYKIPASLIPTVIYNVELDGTDTDKPKSITRDAAFPLQLVAEVGLRSDVNAVNLEQKVAEYVEKGGHAHKNADGTYSFYTNRWGYGHGDEVDYDEPLTHVVAQSHFHPATDNSRYYFTENTQIFVDEEGTPYTGANAPAGGTYYHARSFYEVENGTVVYETKYLPISAVTLAQAIQQGNNWYIPAGVPFQETERFRVEKAPNTTATLTYADYPAVLHNADGYNCYAFLGNNGKLTASPAQGIALSKTVSEVSDKDGAPTEFTFTVTLSQAVASPSITDANGDAIDAEKWSVSGSVITVRLSAGETVYITGIPTGTTYTVEEEESSYYTASSANASGTVAAYTVNNVAFDNAAKGYGSLIVSKDVNYPEGFVPGTAHNSKEFAVTVTFTGDITGMEIPTGAVRSGNAFTLSLKDGESVTFADIPEDVTYTVSESGMPSGGYSLQEIRYSDAEQKISAEDADRASVVNQYTLQPVSPNVKIQGSKTLVTNESSWNGASFTVELFRIDDFADQEPVSTGLTATMTEADKDYEIDLSGISFTQAGIYYFRAVEVIPEDRDENIAYDRTYGLFSITVGDADADGALEIQNISAYQTTTVSGNAASGWTLQKDFTNVVTTDRVYLDIRKNVVDASDNTPVNAHLGDITFGLFANTNAGATPVYYMLTDTAGEATIMVPVTQQIITEAGGKLVYYLREIAPAAENRVVGMHYDESWLYAIEITWDETTNDAVIRYAPMENGTAGAYQTYVDGTTVFNHTNTYEKNVTTQIQLSGEKTLNGKTDLGGREFSFSLYESTAAFVQGDLIETVSNKGNAISFSQVSFSAPGVYYMVAKENASDLGGITVDGAVYHITVEVEKFVDTDGTTRLRLVSGYPSVVKYGTSANVGADGLDFNNIYTVTGSENVTVSGHKTLTGRELIAGEFEFGLYKGEELVSSAKNLTNGNFSFPTITYTAEDIGTHTYTVKEIVPTDKLGGVTYDENTAYTVVVKVEDNGEGGITVTKTVNGASDTAIEFENFYNSQPIDVKLTGSKTLYNQDTGSNITLNGGEFTFNLYESDQTFSTQGEMAVPAVTNGAGGTISILLEDLEAGDYYYILREDLGNATGMHYDTSVFNIRVLVTDNGDGTLRSLITIQKSGNGANAIAFGNNYDPEPTEFAIAGTKELTGRDIIDGEFTFELYEGSTLLQTAENVGDGFTFEAIEYEKSGTYTYTVKEQIPQQAVNGVYKGVTYDDTVYTVTVTVSDQNGTLQAVASHTAQQLTFNNKYEGADTHFSVDGKKTLEDKDLEAGMFSFELRDKNGVHIATVRNAADGSFSFRNIPLAAADDYTYTIREVIPDDAEQVDGKWIYKGITYSSDTYTVEVSVTDPGAGQLVAGTPVITKNGGTEPVSQADFTNDYNVEPIEVTIRGIKELTGRELKQGEFSFTLAGHGYLLNTTNKADGAIVFTPVKLDAEGTYTFSVSEYQGDKGGIGYDGNTYQVTVEVTDNGDGTLSAEVIYPNGILKFSNTYTVKGDTEFTVAGTKTMDGRLLNEEDVFEFQLQDSAGTVLQTVEAVDGEFSLTQKLDKLGLHTFTLTEKRPQGGVKDGVTYSTQVYTITVNVTDDGNGGMRAAAPIITYLGVDVTSVEFVNRYTTASAKLDLTATKDYEKGFAQDVFTFHLTGHGEDQEKTNDAQGNVVFDTIYLDKTGSYTFTITEENSGLTWVDYDETTYKVTVQVKDDGKGQLYVDPDTITYTADGDVATGIVFDNDYLLKKNSVAIGGDKVLTENGIQQNLTGGEFTFGLYEGDQQLQTKSNIAGGGFTFEAIEYQHSGEHTYTVREIIPTDREEGMIYDETVYTVKVSVTDDNKGNLIVDKQLVGAENILFTNTRHEIIVKDVAASAAPGVSINGQKVAQDDILVYSITYTNTTGKDVTATITDTLPDYTQFVSASDGGTCTEGTVTWTLDVKKNEEKTVTVNVRVDAPQQILINDATVYDGTHTYTSDEVYVHTVEEKLVKDVAAKSAPDISIDGEKVAPGEELLYTLNYYNATAEAQTVTITDKIPAHTSFKSVDARGTYNGTDTVQWTLQVAPWSIEEVSFTVTVDEQDSFIDNTATALVGTDQFTSNTVTNHTYEEVGGKDVTLMSEPSVSIDGKMVKIGDVLEYTISYTNITETPVDVTITDRIPEYTKLLSAKEGIVKDGVITWKLEAVQPRQEVKVSFMVTVTGAGVQIENQAQIFDGTNKLTNTVTNSVPKKTVDKQTASTGEILTYTITYINSTGKTADVVITDKLDAALSYVDGTAGTGVYADGIITWSFRGVPAGERITVTFQAKVKADADKTSVSNVAEVIENEVKIVSTNDTVVEVKKPALSILKEQAVGNGTATVKQQSVKAGDVVSYTITVTNTGEGDAYGITVTDKLPEGLSYVEASANQSGAVKDGIVSWKLDTLAAGQSVKLTFQVTVPKVDKDTTWKNVAAVVCENNPNGDKPTESGGVEIELKIPATPQTGDGFSAVLFIGLMVLSSFGLVAVIICKKREEEAQTQQ